MENIDSIKKIFEDIGSFAITFDTCSFHEHGYRLHSYPIEKLHILKEMGITVVFSDIIAREIKKHILDSVLENKKNINTSLKNIKKYINGEHVEIQNFSRYIEKIDSIVSSEIENFMDLISSEILDLNTHGNINEIFEMYFECKPPFENKKEKKCEFPDAGALKSIENWAIKNDKKIIAVTNDKGWRTFCDKKEKFYVIPSIRDLINILQNDNRFFAVNLKIEIVHGKHKNILKYINDTIKEKIDTTTFDVDISSPDMCECNVEYIEFESLDFSNFHIFINKREDTKFDVYFAGSVPVTASISTDFYVWDSIDKEYIDMGGKSFLQNIELDYSISLILEENNGNWNILEHYSEHLESTLSFACEISDL